MTRKLLPYEYDLIDALGISKEEYLEFVYQQHAYKDAKEGSVLDVQAGPLTPALVLAIVGIVFQVVALLIMGSPTAPPQSQGNEQTRDQRTTPRFGFNGAQEIAKYGQPVPLVYTNTSHNDRGGVRIATLLLWSAVLSYGNNQLMRLMLAIGASGIRSIDPARTALGQFPVKDLVASNIWQYFNSEGATTFSNLLAGTSGSDPTVSTLTSYTAQLNGLPETEEGFSQAFSPTTSNTVGVTGTIPINCEVLVLNDEGGSVLRLVDTSFVPISGSYWGNDYIRNPVPVGSQWRLIVPNTAELLLTSDTPGNARQDALRSCASLIDKGSTFKAGSVLFRVVSVSYGNVSNGIEEANLNAVLEVTRTGRMPKMPYGTTHWSKQGSTEAERQRIQGLINANIAKIGKTTDAPVDRNFKGTYWAGVTYDEDGNISYIPVSSGGGGLGQRGGGYSQYVQVPYDNSSASLFAYRNFLVTKNNTAEIKKVDADIARLQAENVSLQSQLDAIPTLSVADFHTKGLTRVEEAAYASVTKCHVLDFAIRYQAYRRISGRASVYGSKQVSYGHSASDNGVKPRTAMFLIWCRIDEASTFSLVPYIFCCRGITEQNIFAYFKLLHTLPVQWEVKLEAVVDPFAECRTNTIKGYCYLNPSAPLVTLTSTQLGIDNLKLLYNGSLSPIAKAGDLPPLDKSPKSTTEFDLFNYDAYSTTSFSFDNSPEITITAVNEQRREKWATYSPTLYKGLTILGLHVISGAGTQDLRSVSTFVKEGKAVRLLSTDPNAYGNELTKIPNDTAITALVKSTPSNSSSYPPDIFLDTVLDADNGIGQFSSIHSVDVQQLAITKRFCIRNKLFFDCSIADQRPWREFWAQVAPFALLELAKIGGKDTLVPSLPYNPSTGAITRDINISALFNPGNILEDSFKEEFLEYGANVKDAIITAIYRDTERNGIFQRNNSVEVKLTNTLESNATRETVDVSQYVTTREQAILLGKALCQFRRHNRRAVEFKTFPTESVIMPGAYIYVETANNMWDGIYTGRIEDNGILNVPVTTTVPNGTYTVLTYSSESGPKTFPNVVISNNTATSLKAQSGQLFVLGTLVQQKRTYRITEVTMEEEGETTVRAVEHPLDSSGKSLITYGLTERVPGLFLIDGSPE